MGLTRRYIKLTIDSSENCFIPCVLVVVIFINITNFEVFQREIHLALDNKKID